MLSWWSHFKTGFASCLAICAVIAGVAVYLNDKILDTKDAEIQRLEGEIAKSAEASESFHKEHILRKQAEIRAAEAESQLSILLADKWEEKFETERIAKQTAQEKAALVQAKYEELVAQIDSGKTEPSKDLEITRLREELSISRNEFAKISNLYTQEKQKPPRVIKVPLGADPDDEHVFKMVQAAVPQMMSSDRSNMIISTYKDSRNTITVSQLALLSAGMMSRDNLSTIRAIAANIRNDGDPKTLNILLSSMTSSDAKEAMQIIMALRKQPTSTSTVP